MILFFVLLCALVFAPIPADAAYSLIASTSVGAGSDGDNITSPGIDTTGANLIVVGVCSYAAGGAGSNPTLSDSNTNTWSGLTTSTHTNSRYQLYYVFGPSVGANHTFTASSTNGLPSLAIMAFSGSVTAPFDQQNGATAAAATSVQPGSVTPTLNDELLVAGICHDNLSTNFSINLDFVLEETVALVGGQHLGSSIAYLVQGTAAATNPTWSWSTSSGVATRIATFKAAVTRRPVAPMVFQ